MHVTEAPLIGAAIGGLIGGGGTLAGFATLGGMAGMALGAVGGSLLGKSMKAPKVETQSQQSQQQQAIAETPALPPATEMPAAPATPVATPIPQAVGEVSTPTAEELAAGQINTEKKRKGRLSTILSTPKSRLEGGTYEGETMERLGG